MAELKPKFKVDEVVRAEWEGKSVIAKIIEVNVYNKLNFIGYKLDTDQHFREEELSSNIRVGDIVKSEFNGHVSLVTRTGTGNANVVQVQVANNGSFRLCTDLEIEHLTEDKFNEIKKVNESDIKFGTVVKLQTRLLKIKESKLQDLRIKYGRCLSEKQHKQIKEDLYDDSDNNPLTINYEDLETTSDRIMIGMISGINNHFGYYFSEYSQHSNSFNGSNKHCVHYVHKRNITLFTPGLDFEDYFTWTDPEIIEILSPAESSKYLEKQKDFYSLI